jgi:hypothetical protein
METKGFNSTLPDSGSDLIGNAPAERLFGILKSKRIYRQEFAPSRKLKIVMTFYAFLNYTRTTSKLSRF